MATTAKKKAAPVVEKEPGTAVARAKIVLPADIKQRLQEEAARMLQTQLGSSGGSRIKATRKGFTLPNGDTLSSLEAVIVDFVSANYYYEGAFDPNDVTPPTCAALNVDSTAMTPFDYAPERQSESCVSCPKNQWGSAERGNGKACSNCYLLAVLPPDATEETDLMVLKVSPTGRKSFEGYVAGVARSFATPPFTVITEITLDANLDYPSLRFGNPQPNPAFQLAMARVEEARKMLLTPPSFEAREAVKQQPAAKGKSRRAA